MERRQARPDRCSETPSATSERSIMGSRQCSVVGGDSLPEPPTPSFLDSGPQGTSIVRKGGATRHITQRRLNVLGTSPGPHRFAAYKAKIRAFGGTGSPPDYTPPSSSRSSA